MAVAAATVAPVLVTMSAVLRSAIVPQLPNGPIVRTNWNDAGSVVVAPAGSGLVPGAQTMPSVNTWV
jgi:hypothetical protein